MQFVGEAMVPAGFAAMCGLLPDQCGGGDTPADAILPAAPDLKQLRRLNRMVNRKVVQRLDAPGQADEDLWRPSGIGPGATGDCEDMALEKRNQLIAMGYPPSALLMAVVYRRHVGLHAVLVVRTGAGDYVLDNLTDRVRPWHRTGYSWLSVQSPDDPLRWMRPDQPA